MCRATRQWKLAVLSTLLSCLMVSGASAVLPASSVLNNQGNFGGQVGYFKSTDGDSGEYLLGGHLELHLAHFLGIRGDASYRTDETYNFQAQGNDLSLEVRTIPITASARVYAPLPINLIPYGLAGAGWYHIDYTFSDDAKALFDLEDTTETTFGWHVGAGLLVSLGPRMALFGEYRAIFMDPEREFDEAIQQTIKDLDFDTSNIMAGISLYF
ncbi:MAG: porin family protein [Candidatus Eisenbacteria bacterium]|uniref:Porin family protein n=1 Tax=Eiseniibacteriota bacterium TaxID=2212470 RepID=A0A7Y2EB50_UNCEI|nr:porin family protein [Candidatus Eisenbacteria bacterium]